MVVCEVGSPRLHVCSCEDENKHSPLLGSERLKNLKVTKRHSLAGQKEEDSLVMADIDKLFQYGGRHGRQGKRYLACATGS